MCPLPGGWGQSSRLTTPIVAKQVTPYRHDPLNTWFMQARTDCLVLKLNRWQQDTISILFYYFCISLRPPLYWRKKKLILENKNRCSRHAQWMSELTSYIEISPSTCRSSRINNWIIQIYLTVKYSNLQLSLECD